MRYQNPVIPGFHPDPSITQKGDDFYLVTSTFEYFPGVPVFHSRNLVNWEQVGWCLSNERQLNLRGVEASKGIYAPTIRYHDGMFYMITTVTDQFGGRKNIIVRTEDPAKTWSDPAVVDWQGIDPSLFFDDDGKCYYTGTGSLDGKRIMACFEIDPVTGERLGPVHDLGPGCGGPAPEAPHLFKKDDWYYYILAEGGTEYGHMETVHRSKTVFGPYESAPNNPILCHVNRKGYEIQGTGHADFIEDRNGNWWALFLAFRNYSKAWLHNIGRETFLMPVTWDEEGWPTVGKEGYADLEVDADLPGEVKVPDHNFHADFKQKDLDLRFFHTRNPYPEDYVHDPYAGTVTLIGHGVSLETNEDSPTMLNVVQPAFETAFSVTFDLNGTNAEKAGITAYLSNDYHYDLYLSDESGQTDIVFAKAVHDIKAEFRRIPLCSLFRSYSAGSPAARFGDADRLRLRDDGGRDELPGKETLTLLIRTDRKGYSFYVRKGNEEVFIGFGSNAGLSTEQTMTRTFTGTIFSAFCIGGAARLLSFDVDVLES